MNASEFRKELMKIMPGYSWTVHQTKVDGYLSATGTQSSGSNRLSTLSITRRERDGKVAYEAKSAGYGLRARWLHMNADGTLARALRGLQDHYEGVAETYKGHAEALKVGRCLAHNAELRGASRLAGEASSAEGATSNDVFGGIRQGE